MSKFGHRVRAASSSKRSQFSKRSRNDTEIICSAQTDKTDDKRYDLEVKTQKTAKEIAELETRIKGIKGEI